MKIVKDLFLAVLNATLILVAVCLILGLMVARTAERAADRFHDGIETIRPLQTQVSDATAALVGLREDINALRTRPGALSPEARASLEARIDALSATMAQMETRFEELDEIPERLASSAINTAADRIEGFVSSYRSCTPEG